MCKSLPQMPVVVTLRIASVGEFIFGFASLGDGHLPNALISNCLHFHE
jgi:hypothetical protein